MYIKSMLFCIALSTALIAGCNSGGKSSSDQEPTLGEASPKGPEEVTDSPVAATVQTFELQVDASFDFATSWNMHINFMPPLQNSFLSLCTDYEEGDTA